MIPKQVLKNPLATQKRSPNIQVPSLLKSMTKENGRHKTAVRKSDSDSDMIKALVTVRSCRCLMMTTTTAELPKLERRKMERSTRAWVATVMPCRTELLSAALSTDGVDTCWNRLSSLPLWSLKVDMFPVFPIVASVVVVTRLCKINFKAEINWVDSVSYLGTTGELSSWLVKLELRWSAVKLVLPLPCRAVPTGESIDKAHNESHPFRLQSVLVGFMGLNHSRRPLLLIQL
ncbi:hypothetical protein EYF80_014980 [Liparis tanakae]|uniref:Uncharacterized protein n=1 Tax=Liparis tanakae TaxID=230148 RepID=A0A4Z2IAH7_9TELE|nr:hypothetical protein EYF80_014980 [Liparis tanakae]